jgi:hypothetical protein
MNTNNKLIIIFLLFLQNLPSVFLYLNHQSWNHINSFLQNKNKYQPEEVNKVHKIIYTNYEKWALYKSYLFKKLHYYKCKEITQSELNLYASLGLHKAIQNYNPEKNVSFSFYATNYVMGELYNCMTILQTNNYIVKRERRRKHYNRNNKSKTDSHIHVPMILGTDDYLFSQKQKGLQKPDLFDYRYNINLHNVCESFWERIESMDIPPLTKKIMKLKYSFDFTQSRSNKYVSILLCCSEETVRQHVNKFRETYAELLDIDTNLGW